MSTSTPFDYDRIDLSNLTNSQTRQHHLQKACAVLATFGVEVDHRTEKRGEADFLAKGIQDGKQYQVAVRSQLTLDKRYQGEDIHVMFPEEGSWYVYPHDELLTVLGNEGMGPKTRAWEKNGEYVSSSLSGSMEERILSLSSGARVEG